MSVDDKLAIQEMIARYSYAYDGKDPEAFAQLFVEDGIFEVIVPGESGPTIRLSSRAAIREWAAQRHQLHAASQSRHCQFGVLFDELTAEAASARTMLLLTRQGAPDAAPILHLTGVYHDKWRKTREGWRLILNCTASARQGIPDLNQFQIRGVLAVTWTRGFIAAFPRSVMPRCAGWRWPELRPRVREMPAPRRSTWSYAVA